MDHLANFAAWCRDSRTFRLGVLIILGAIGAALCDQMSWKMAAGTALLAMQTMLARVGGFNDAKDVQAGRQLEPVNPPRASQAGRASLGALVSVAAILALASLVGCVAAETKKASHDLADALPRFVAASQPAPGQNPTSWREDADAITTTARVIDADLGGVSK